MDFRKINYDVMNDTVDLCSKLNYLKNAIADSVSRERIVFQDDKVESGSIVPNRNMKIMVSGRRTYEAAEQYNGKKICCLDFANNHNVGGSPWSAGAQEESMCRISTLYPCIFAKKKEFYDPHRKSFEDGLMDEMGNDDLIYVPDVVVFKSDDFTPKLKDESEWFKTDVIVSAAPQLGWNYDEKKYRTVMESRIKRILDVASVEKVQALILGAFGCGAFNNPPEIVADVFADMIRNYDFETVEFAVFCYKDTTNFDVFERRFKDLTV